MSDTKKLQNKKAEPEKKPQKVFGRIGYGLSLAGLILFWIPVVALGFSIPGLVFANNAAKKGNTHMEFNKKARNVGIAGVVLGSIVTLVVTVLIPVLAAMGKL